ncbi:MAG: hypothetical protein QOH10_1236, partial [Actinomycetota bacterium]|nr:hypothetical protein [Actinomycetota bacterium]
RRWRVRWFSNLRRSSATRPEPEGSGDGFRDEELSPER